MVTPKVLKITNKWEKDQNETVRETFKANKDVKEVVKETVHLDESKPEQNNEVRAAMRSRMGGVSGPRTGGGGGGRGARYRHLYQQEKFSITTNIQDMLGSHHRLDMGSSWREQRSPGVKINKDLVTEKETTKFLEDKNNSATTHIKNCIRQEAGKRSNMKKKQEGSSKVAEIFKKMDYKDGKVVLKSKTELCICPI